MESEVFFRSAGLKCAADLYLPDDLRSGSKRPGLVIGHGFTVVKEALVEHGRAFGGRQVEPRQAGDAADVF